MIDVVKILIFWRMEFGDPKKEKHRYLYTNTSIKENGD